MDSDSEDDIDWEEVQVTAQHEQQEDHLEITIQTRAKPSEKSEKSEVSFTVLLLDVKNPSSESRQGYLILKDCCA